MSVTDLDRLVVRFPSSLPPLDGPDAGMPAFDPGARTHRPVGAPMAGGPAGRVPAGFDDFAALLGRLLEVDPIGWHPDVAVADLGWDSLTMIELLGGLDHLGVQLPEQLIPQIRTLGDVHAWARGGAEPATCPRDPFRGPNVVIAPVTARDEEWLFRLHTSGDHLSRYRLRGVTPSPETFHRFLWERVLAQFVVRTHAGEPVGLVSCFDADHRNRHAHLAAVGDPEWTSSGLVLEGMALLISYVFDNWDLRKLYAETLAGNYAQFANGAGRVFSVEGRLRGHEFRAGGYEDVVILAVERDGWARHHDRVLGGVGGS